MSDTKNKLNYTFSEFIMKVIQGATSGIIVAVIPNAIFGEIFSSLIPVWSGFAALHSLVQIIQLLMPILVGIGVAKQFELNLMQMLSVGAAGFLASGNVIDNNGMWEIVGIGDTVNTMLISGIAVLIALLIQEKMKSFATIAYPTLIAGGAGIIGVLTLPYVSSITALIGSIVASATQLQPILMSIIISIMFAILILTPFSVIAIAIAISLSGIGSGAANLGTVATVVLMAYGSYRAKNKTGITASIILGGVKTMMPNLFKKFQISIPIIIVAGIMGALAPILNIQGTPASAGFGFAGLVGPIVAYGYLDNSVFINILILVMIYAVIPIVLSLSVYKLCTNVFKIIKDSDFEATI